ncbi:MAG: hypothetical protein H6622_00605 [Halobacteriovoraceae bacterium]|nr:hypothetical protein [Halobacteriovoraceae bacterium]
MKHKIFLKFLTFFLLVSSLSAQNVDPLFGLENEFSKFSTKIHGPIILLPNIAALPFVIFSDFGLTLGISSLVVTISTGGFFLGQTLNRRALEKYYEHAKKNEQNLNVEVVGNQIKIINSNKFHLIAKNDFGVIEFNNSPSTVSFFKENIDFVDEFMFKKTKNLKLGPKGFLNSGQIHIDYVTGLEENPQLLIDFLVDLTNHPGLYRGPLSSSDKFTSKDPLSNIRKFRKVLNYFNSRKSNFKRIIRLLKDAGLGRVGDGHAFSLRKESLETRFWRPQYSVHEIILFLDLIKARLNYLKKHPNQKLKPLFPTYFTYTYHKQMKKYVEESGLDWNEYEKILPRSWIRLFNFEKKIVNYCQKLFKRH